MVCVFQSKPVWQLVQNIYAQPDTRLIMVKHFGHILFSLRNSFAVFTSSSLQVCCAESSSIVFLPSLTAMNLMHVLQNTFSQELHFPLCAFINPAQVTLSHGNMNYLVCVIFLGLCTLSSTGDIICAISDWYIYNNFFVLCCYSIFSVMVYILRYSS
jgi:hypothetical protein